MYSMKPIYTNVDSIEIPDNIYKMKSLHIEDDVSQSSAGSNTTLNPRMQQLEERQLSILKKLSSLEDEVKQMSKHLGHKYGDSAPITKTTSSASTTASIPNKPVSLPDGTLDFVISVSAKNPSFSPMLIGELLKKRGVSVAFPTHGHSSCKDGSLTAEVLKPYGGALNGRLGTSTKAKVFLTFLIKDVPFCPSVMYSPVLQTKIIGDVNIARYLTRFLLSDLYDENNAEVVGAVDGWLDTARQMGNGNSKEKDAALKSLNAHLGRNQGFLCSGRFTLADLAVLSALLGARSNFKSLPKNAKAWFQTMASSFDLNNFDVPSAWVSS